MAVHVHHAFEKGDDDGGENPMEKMSEMFGPGHVDQAVRSAIQACWMALPKESRNVEEVGKEARSSGMSWWSFGWTGGAAAVYSSRRR